METFPYEKQLQRSVHQGLLKSSQIMTKIQVYDLNKNIIISLPPTDNERRLSIVFFYIDRCVPSIVHLNYFAIYASSHSGQVIIYLISTFKCFFLLF